MKRLTYNLDNGLKIIQCRDGKPGYRIKPGDGQVKELPLRLVRCFPWQHTDAFISLRDHSGKEIALLESLDVITDPAVKQMLIDELNFINYVPEIQHIESILHKAELYHWNVVTSAGKRNFYMRRNEIPRQLANDGVLIKDISGDRYLINRMEDLDRKSKDWLWAYLD